DMKRIDELSRKAPNICKVSPASRYHVEDVARAGGIHTILGEVNRGRPGLLDLTCRTVTGKTLGENIADFDTRPATPTQAARLLTRVRAGGERTSQAWTVPSVASESRSQAAGLAVLESEGEDLVSPANEPGGGGGDGFDPYDVIRTVDNAYSQTGGLSMLYGNLAPEGAVVKTAGVHPKMLRHTGPAVIFESEE